MSKRGDDDDAPPDYSALDRVTDGDVFDTSAYGGGGGGGISNSSDKLQTLLELREGANGATAAQMIEVKTYEFALVSNFMGVRLNHTSGAPHPACFDTETRRFIEDKPFFQVKMSDGNQPPYVYKGYTKHDKDAL